MQAEETIETIPDEETAELFKTALNLSNGHLPQRVVAVYHRWNRLFYRMGGGALRPNDAAMLCLIAGEEPRKDEPQKPERAADLPEYRFEPDSENREPSAKLPEPEPEAVHSEQPDGEIVPDTPSPELPQAVGDWTQIKPETQVVCLFDGKPRTGVFKLFDSGKNKCIVALAEDDGACRYFRPENVRLG